jgi:ABC-2 type transport system permease protein
VTERQLIEAIRIGVDRGWTMFRHMMTTIDGLANTVFWNAMPLAFLVLNGGSDVEGAPVTFGALALPGFIGLAIAAAAYGPAYYIAAEREDGTVLRARTLPHGVTAYVTGVLVLSILETAITIAVLALPGFLLFRDLELPDVGGWLTLVAVTLLGLAATLPIGVMLGSVIRNARLIGGVGLLVLGGMTVISGIFIPVQVFPGAIQLLAQALPTYWIGIGMRSVFLPDAAMVWEIGGSWRTLEMFAVLVGWSVLGAVLAPRLLRRMTRRATGAAVEESRQQALQRL